MRLLAQLILFFLAAQLIGTFVAVVLSEDYSANPYVQDLYLKEQGSSESIFDVALLLGLILLGTLVIILLIKYYKGQLLFLLMEFFLISVTSSVFFYSLFRIGFPYLESMGIGILLGIILAIGKIKYLWLKNPSATIAAGVVGALFGISFSPSLIILFLVFLFIYDYIAVFKTKHMVEMAKFITKKEMPFTITSKVKLPGKKEQRIDLGTGDLLAPIMLGVSFLSINPLGYYLSFLGGIIGILVIYYILSKKRMFLPALPPIVGAMLVLLGIAYVFGLL